MIKRLLKNQAYAFIGVMMVYIQKILPDEHFVLSIFITSLIIFIFTAMEEQEK